MKFNAFNLSQMGSAGTLALAFAAGAIAPIARAADEQYIGKVPKLRVIVQPQPSFQYVQSVQKEFEDKWKTKIEVVTLGENERRARSRVDASTGSGSFQIYYIDEANVSEFAEANWVLPLLDYYPKEYDYDDFLAGRKAVATVDGKPYFAPLLGGGDVFMYRKDILQAKGIPVPKTLDELIAAIQKAHNPPQIYGFDLRGQRGSGMNVWRWTPYFRADGGKWFDGDKPAFDSDPAIKAIQTYVNLLKFCPPGATTGTWSDAVEAFRSGQVAFMIESDPLGLYMVDKSKSQVSDKVGFAAPPDPLPSAGYAHGLAISAKGCPDEATRHVAAEFIAWATSKDMEARRMKAGVISDFARSSTLDDPNFKKSIPADFIAALQTAAPKTDLLIWRNAGWPALGDELGLVLEQIFTGQRTDVKAALDEVATFAKEQIENK
jgi:multiple sugar transport system substrate-binding protein